MKKKWWEDPMSFICDYWWAFLAVILLLLVAIFTYNDWAPLVGINPIPNPTLLPLATVPGITPQRTLVPAISGIDTATPTPSTAIQFNDPQGTYTLSYPQDWTATDAGNQAQQWQLPSGAVVSIHAEPAQPGDTLDSFAQEVVTQLPYDVLSQTSTQVGGQLAIRQEVAFPGETQPTAVGYLVLYKGKKYQIALSGLQTVVASDRAVVIQQFEKTLATFQFQQ